MANWRLAKSLTQLRKQINEAHPARSKVSDGSVGDTRHQAKGKGSDHNPNAQGIVTAIDITHDPASGIDGKELNKSLIADPRTKYVIFAGRIWKARTGKWETYRGANKHDKHVHISVKAESADDDQPWNLGKAKDKPAETAPKIVAALPLQSSTLEVKTNAATGEVTASPPANEMVVAPPAAVDAGSKKSLWATIISIPALIFGYLTQNIGEALGWLKDREVLKWFLIVGGAVFALYMIRQIVMSAIRQIGAILLTRESMKTLADPDAKNVSVAQTKEVAE